MRRQWIFFFIGILLLTILAIAINLAQPYSINFTTKLPFSNKPLAVHYHFAGLKTAFSLGPVHFQKDLSLKKGLDLQGGTSITLRADMKGIPKSEQQSAIDSAQAVI